MRTQRRARAAGLLLAAAAALAFTGGCEAIVSDSLPATIGCTGPTPGACPIGYECASGRCVECATPGCIVIVTDAGHDAGHDAGPLDAGHDAADATLADGAGDTGAALGGLGAECAATSNCATGLFCLPSNELTNLGVASNSVCSRPCCKDSDCGASNVCYPTTGGNFCVTASAASHCTGGSCGTACCADADCAGGGSCALGTTYAGSSVPSCQKQSSSSLCGQDSQCTGGDGADCFADSDCTNGACSSGNTAGQTCDSFTSSCQCVAQTGCCSASACTGSGGGKQACGWYTTYDATGSQLVFRACNGTTAGAKANGETCTPSDTCAGGVCANFTKLSEQLCTSPCCQDADCASVGPEWVCRPYPVTIGLGSLPLLVCEPPRAL